MKKLNIDEMLEVAGGYWEGERPEGGDGGDNSGNQDFLKLPVFK